MAEQKQAALKNEIAKKKAEIEKLLSQKENIKADLCIIEEKLEQTTDRIAVRNNEFATRKRRAKELEKQKESLKEKAFVESAYQEEVIDIKHQTTMDIKRKLLKLISSRQELDSDPNELFFYDGLKAELKSNIMIHTVKIKLIQPSPQTTKNQAVKIIPKEATFRIDKKMKFSKLKEHACRH